MTQNTLNAKGLEAARKARDAAWPMDSLEPIIHAYLEALREAPVSSEKPIADETGWLIELRGNEPKWWSLDYNPEPDWIKDANRALRFARKDDADAYINDIGWTEAFASEHIWPYITQEAAKP